MTSPMVVYHLISGLLQGLTLVKENFRSAVQSVEVKEDAIGLFSLC